jgi:CHAD domain
VREVIGEPAFERANSQLKAAANVLAGRRRGEALVIVAEKLAAGSASGGKLVHMARSYRDEHGDPIGGGLVPGAAQDTLRQTIVSITGDMAMWRIPKDSDRLLRDAFLCTYRKARKRLARALESEDIAELHEARKLVIHHLHHLEFLRGYLAGATAERIGELNTLREALGDLNDLEELQRIAKSRHHEIRGAALDALRARRKRLSALVRKAWKPLFKRKTQRFARRIGAMWWDSRS